MIVQNEVKMASTQQEQNDIVDILHTAEYLANSYMKPVGVYVEDGKYVTAFLEECRTSQYLEMVYPTRRPDLY